MLKMFPVLFLVLLNLFSTLATDANNTSHSENNSTFQLESLEYKKAFEEPVRSEDNIFFLETFCVKQSSERHLNPRQSCAIESAALRNPSHKIYLLFTCDMTSRTLPQHVRQLLRYNNVRFWKLEPSLLVAGTVAEQWWTTGKLLSSRYRVVHASDLLRLVALWKYGGTYMDLDVVVFKSLAGLSNFAGAQDSRYVGNAVLNVDSDGDGHEFVGECLEDFLRSYDGDDWEANGPLLVTRILNKRCNVSETQQMTPQRCKGFTVLPPEKFYPIAFGSWEQYFEENDPSTGYLMNLTQNSLAVHVWNRLSAGTAINVGSNQTYALLAAKHCPTVYPYCQGTVSSVDYRSAAAEGHTPSWRQTIICIFLLLNNKAKCW